MSNGPEWFAAKRYGYGAGLPIAWQGWAVTLVYLAIVSGSIFLFEDRPAVFLAIGGIASLLMIFVAARTTRGGWRWRWGRDA